jgi:hypothetical protein
METTASVPVPQASACATLGAFDTLAHCHEHIQGKLERLAALADEMRVRRREAGLLSGC